MSLVIRQQIIQPNLLNIGLDTQAEYVADTRVVSLEIKNIFALHIQLFWE